MSVRPKNNQKSDLPKKDLSAFLKLEFYRKKDKWKLADLKTEIDNKQVSQPDLNLTYTIESTQPEENLFNEAMIHSSVSQVGVSDESTTEPQTTDIDWETILEHYLIENPNNINAYDTIEQNPYQMIEQEYQIEKDSCIYECNNNVDHDLDNSNMLFELLSGKKKPTSKKVLKNDLDKQKIPWLDLIHQLNITCDDYQPEELHQTNNMYEVENHTVLYEYTDNMYEGCLVNNYFPVYEPEILYSCGPPDPDNEWQNDNHLQVASECSSSTNSTKFIVGANLVSHSSEADIYNEGLRNYE